MQAFNILESQEPPANLSFRVHRELLPGWPKSAQRICHNGEHGIERGTHIVFQVISPPFRAKFQSALVVEVHKNHIQVIMNCAKDGGVVKRYFLFRDLLKQAMHKITYAAELYHESKAVERAESRLKHNEKCYHVLKNNSHFFVTWCITGREQSLADILRELEDHQNPLESK